MLTMKAACLETYKFFQTIFFIVLPPLKRYFSCASTVTNLPFENVKIYKEMYGNPTLSDKASGCHTFFVNFDVFKSLYLSQN